MTNTTEQIIRQAAIAGLNPSTVVEPVRGAREITFDQGGKDGAFGLIRVGVRTGRITSATITHGNSNLHRPVRCVGAVETRRALRSV